MKKVIPETMEHMEDGPVCGTPKKSKESKKIFPKLRLENNFFPETKEQEVGKTYKIELEVKMVGLSISRFSNDSEYYITGYDIKDIKSNKTEEKAED